MIEIGDPGDVIDTNASIVWNKRDAKMQFLTASGMFDRGEKFRWDLHENYWWWRGPLRKKVIRIYRARI